MRGRETCRRTRRQTPHCLRCFAVQCDEKHHAHTHTRAGAHFICCSVRQQPRIDTTTHVTLPRLALVNVKHGRRDAPCLCRLPLRHRRRAQCLVEGAIARVRAQINTPHTQGRPSTGTADGWLTATDLRRRGRIPYVVDQLCNCPCLAGIRLHGPLSLHSGPSLSCSAGARVLIGGVLPLLAPVFSPADARQRR